jgi:hypothetical protein
MRMPGEGGFDGGGGGLAEVVEEAAQQGFGGLGVGHGGGVPG